MGTEGRGTPWRAEPQLGDAHAGAGILWVSFPPKSVRCCAGAGASDGLLAGTPARGLSRALCGLTWVSSQHGDSVPSGSLRTAQRKCMAFLRSPFQVTEQLSWGSE